MFNQNNYQNNNGYRRAGYSTESGSRTEQPAAAQLPAFDLANIVPELFDTTADKCAKIISSSNVNKSTQLRRFYDELVMWYERANTDDEAFKNALPFIYMIKSKVAYARGRKNVDDNFLSFMNKLINQIKDRKTLKNAKLFMEAVMGFYKQYKQD